MAINHEEIIEEIERHIRKLGGERSEWCAGTAKDARAPFFRRHLAADLGDGLIYREAFTTSAAEQVIDHLVNACGLRLAPEAEGGSTANDPAERRSTADRAEGSSALHDALQPGRIVFVYRPTRDSGFGIRETGYGRGDTGLGAGDSGLGIRDTDKSGAGQPAPQAERPAFRKLAA